MPRDNTELLQRKESKAKRNLLSSETSRWQNKVSLSTPCCATFPTFCPQQPRDPWLGLCAWFPSATKPPHFYIGLGFIWRKSLDYHHLTLWCLCAVWLWVQQGGRGDAPRNSQIPVGDASSLTPPSLCISYSSPPLHPYPALSSPREWDEALSAPTVGSLLAASPCSAVWGEGEKASSKPQRRVIVLSAFKPCRMSLCHNFSSLGGAGKMLGHQRTPFPYRNRSSSFDLSPPYPPQINIYLYIPNPRGSRASFRHMFWGGFCCFSAFPREVLLRRGEEGAEIFLCLFICPLPGHGRGGHPTYLVSNRRFEARHHRTFAFRGEPGQLFVCFPSPHRSEEIISQAPRA